MGHNGAMLIMEDIPHLFMIEYANVEHVNHVNLVHYYP